MKFPSFWEQSGVRVRRWTLLAALTFLPAGVLSAGELPWPVDAGQFITSTFGEPRPGRFHLGLDFTSDRVTGKPVYALGDGWISGVSVSDYGYGKKLTFTLDDGREVLYGHLSAFLPAIEDSLDSLRRTLRQYEAEIAFPPGGFRFHRGDILCWSGESGAGPPHLHVELRDPDGTLLNLLDCGLDADDRVSPVIGDIVFIPLDRESSVDGSPLPKRYDPDDEPPYFSGRVGVAAVLVDHVVSGGTRLGVYRAGLTVDYTSVFSKVYGRISASGPHDGGVDYLPGARVGVSGTLSTFFRRDDHPLGFYTGTGLAPVSATMLPTAHTLEIIAEDRSANVTRRIMPVVFGARPVITVCGFASQSGLRISGYTPSGELDRVEITVSTPEGRTDVRAVPVSGAVCTLSEWVDMSGSLSCRVTLVSKSGVRSLPREVRFDLPAKTDAAGTLAIAVGMLHDCLAATITASGPLAAIPTLSFRRDSGPEEYVLAVPSGGNTWVAGIPLDMTGDAVLRMTARALDSGLREISATKTMRLTRVSPSGESIVYAPDTRFSLSTAPGSVFRSAPVTVDTAGVFHPEGLRPITPAYRVEWGDTPVNGPVRIAFHLKNAPPSHAFVFVSANGETWLPLSGERRGKTVSAEYAGSGLVGMFVDEDEPEIVVATPLPDGVTDSRPVILLRVSDHGSGIDGSASIALFIDKEAVYGEYDSERGEVRYAFRKDLAPGKHRVIAKVTDRAGRKTVRRWEFKVR